MAGAIGVYSACFQPRNLARGEVGEVTIIAATSEQARVVFQYVVGFLEASPVLRQEIEGVTRHEVRLRGNVVLSVRAGNYRTVRGRTLLAAIIDEVAFLRDEGSASPDIELYRALLPSLATTSGMLVAISTPYRRTGLLYQKHRDFFGVDDPDVLVISGSVQRFNPTLDVSIIERARASDPESARSEWDAEFRSDLAAFLDDQTIEAAIDHDRPIELPPNAKHRYFAFTDVSGGRRDAYTFALAHREGELTVIDCVRGVKPPFDPFEVTKDYVALARDYRVTTVHGDKYSGEWAVRAFKDAGLAYKSSERSKSEIYLESLPLFTRASIGIPDHGLTLRELRLLERQTHKGGRDSVDHPRNASDDYANALCGVAVMARRPAYDSSWEWVDGPSKVEEAPEIVKARRDRLVKILMAGGPVPFDAKRSNTDA